MTLVSELFSDWNGGLARLVTTHYELSAHLARIGGTTGDEKARLNELGIDIALVTREGTAYLKALSGRFIPDEPFKDIINELARNDNCPGSLEDGWWQRTLDQIVGLTLHHTLSDSPHEFSKVYIRKDGGRPSVPYTIWVTQTGEALLCNPLEDGCWHDHTGHKNVNLSVGLAGRLHELHPAQVQLEAAARVVKWAVEHPKMNITMDKVLGHMDVGTYKGRTQCPGWDSEASGYWKDDLYELF